MTKQEAMPLMMQHEHQTIDANLYSLCTLLAESLADISDRLDDHEMEQFLDIGGAIYRRGISEFGECVPVADLFPTRQDWGYGPEPGWSGYRSER